LWNLPGPPQAAPLVFHRKDTIQVLATAIDPAGSWLATSALPRSYSMVWPLEQRHPYTLFESAGNVWGMAFTPDGRWLAASLEGTLRIWPLTSAAGSEGRVLFRVTRAFISSFEFDPTGENILATAPNGIWLIPLDGSEPRSLEGFTTWAWAVAFSPDGRFAAAGGGHEDPAETLIRIWDLETEAVRVMGPVEGQGNGFMRLLFTPDGDRLISSGWNGARIWDLATGTSEFLGPGHATYVTRDGRFLYASWFDLEGLHGGAAVYDLETGHVRQLPSHGLTTSITLDSTETVVLTGSFDGTIRVGPVSGEEPHILLGHRGFTGSTVSPDGRWIASAGMDGAIKLWPMPDIRQPPLHTLDHDELMTVLKSLTNIRVVPDEESATGYSVGAEPFPGWGTVPTW
jgi:WD40 repeat protein